MVYLTTTKRGTFASGVPRFSERLETVVQNSRPSPDE